jgi:hypothetical protein
MHSLGCCPGGNPGVSCAQLHAPSWGCEGAPARLHHDRRRLRRCDDWEEEMPDRCMRRWGWGIVGRAGDARVGLDECGGEVGRASSGRLQPQTPLPVQDVVIHAGELDGERAVVTLGEWPEAGDVEQGLTLPAYRELARVLEPWLYEGHQLNSDFPPEDLRRWERRFLG